MQNSFYTLALWQVRQGQENKFLRVWRDELAPAFLNSMPTAQGTLIQSLEDPREFYSFGPWDTLEQMQAARSDVQVRKAIDELRSLCEEARPGAFQVVLSIPEH